MLNKLTVEEEKKISDWIGNTVAKNCPVCGQPLVLRQNRTNKNLFLGCLNYPKCFHTEEFPEEFRMELLGQKRLF